MENVAVHKDFKLAAYFIMIAIVVGIVKVARLYSGVESLEQSDYLNLALYGVVIVLLLWLAMKIMKGENWARITFAVTALCILVMAPFVVLHEFASSMFLGSLSSVFGILLLIALLLLYSKGARQWYTDQLNNS
ncbi:MAG: hypothetical protein DWP94_06595 [Flavobacterium sp.]|nr:MAG: hypothetical protein DWP94_06595 [Flavobacterium sp.]